MTRSPGILILAFLAALVVLFPTVVSLASQRNITVANIAESLCYSYLAYYPEEMLNMTSTWRCEYLGDYNIVERNVTQLECPQSISTAIEYDGVTIVRNDTFSLYGYVSYSFKNRLVVVAFRGTNKYSIKNWMENLSILRTAPYHYYPLVELHRGFYHAFGSVRFAVWDAVKAALDDCPLCNRVHFVGHSLGGSIAAVAMGEAIIDGFRELYQPSLRRLSAMDISDKDVFDIELRTFGQPRTGNEAFSWLFKNYTVWRTVKNQDMIPHIPPSYAGYNHLPTELWETSLPSQKCDNPILCLCDGSGEDAECSDSYRLAHSLSDHYSYLGLDSPITDDPSVPLAWRTRMSMHHRLEKLHPLLGSQESQ